VSESTEPASRKQPVTPEGAAKPRGSLSLGMTTGDLLFTSGCVAFDPDSGDIVGETVAEQTRQTLANVGRILHKEGLDFGDVVQAHVHLTDVQRDFAEFDATYREIVPEPMPARTTVGATLAVSGLLVEIDMIALRR
jgi:2-iminobutanoate/2-iminopropanoate deaminase